MLQHIIKKQNQWKIILILLVLIGVLLRFTNLPQKVYWVDEVFTSLRISGYTEKEVSQKLFSDNLLSPLDLQKYQYPAQEKNVFDTIQGLAKYEPQQAPLYFVFLRFWTQIFGNYFGNSIAVIRSCSAFFSVLTIPVMYWLCRELFESKTVIYFAMALMSVSPVYLLYAQEARPYSLWILTILLSSTTLLRSLRVNTIASWLWYSLTLILGFYTFLYTIFVAIGQGIYVISQEGFQLSQKVRLYILSFLIAIIIFIPWLNIVITNKDAVSNYTGWQDGRISLLKLIYVLIGHLGKLFIDFDLSPDINLVGYWLYQFILFLILALIVYALYFLISQNQRKIYIFILSLIVPTGLGIIIIDLIQGKQTAIAARYFMPCYLGVYLAVAYLIDKQFIYSTSQSVKKFWKFIVIILMFLGLLSCVNILQAESWWHKEGGYVPLVGRMINSSQRPLVINEGDFWLISLSHYLPADSKIKVVGGKEDINNLPSGFSDYFVFHSSPNLETMLENSQYSIMVIENIDSSVLFKITK